MELAEEEDFLTSSGKALDKLDRGRSPEQENPKFKNLKANTKKGSKVRPHTAKPAAPTFLGGMIAEDDGFGFSEDMDAAGD